MGCDRKTASCPRPTIPLAPLAHEEFRMQLPQAMAYGNWDFPSTTLKDLAIEIEICGNTDPMSGRYFQLYDGHIGGAGSYFGLQTNLLQPGFGWKGHGLIFSRWGTRNSSDARAASNGWIENAGHEGGFVGVRATVPLHAGKYCCRLVAIGSDSNGVWYEFTVKEHQTGTEFSAGSLRFPKAQINSGGGSWTEVYHGTSQESDVPETELRIHSITANNMALRPTQCRVCYPPHFAHSDAFVENGVLVLRSGGIVSRVHSAACYSI